MWQRFGFTICCSMVSMVSMSMNASRDNKAAQTDKPEDGVDGAIVYNAARDVVENSRSMLLQTVATHVNEAVLKIFPYLARVKTVIRKFSVPVQGVLDDVEVEVTTENKE